MLRRILVPVDGSRFAEGALPVALCLARRDGAKLELVMVQEPPLPITRAGGAPVRDPEYDREIRREARAYLAALLDRLDSSDRARAETALLEGRIVETLRDRVEEREVDLVVMTTHARGGVSRAWLGSVADGLVRQSPVPVLLLRPDGAAEPRPDDPAFGNVLIPLDGSPDGEQIVDRAIEVAGVERVCYTLLRVLASEKSPARAVVPLRGEPPSSRTQRATVDAQLEARVEGLRARRLAVRAETVIDDIPAQGILKRAAESGADLIAMTTRSRGGLERLLLGSVADKGLRNSNLALLLLNPTVADEVGGEQPQY
jgi:nucleotide-binding universal stress UspA family protein